MNKIKSVFIITVLLSLLLSLLLSFSVFAIDLPEPTSNFFVNDFADVIDSETEEELMAIGASLYKQTTAQVVVVTVDSLDGYEVGEYALELGREWGVGSEDEDNGVVLLLSEGDRQVTIQVGYGLEGCLPDGKTGRILDRYAVQHFSYDDFSTGLSEAYKVIVATVCDEYGVELSDEYKLHLYEYDNTDTGFVIEADNFAAVFIVIMIALAVVFLILGRISGGGSGHGGSHYGGGRVYRGSTFSGGSFRSGGFSGGGGFRGGGGSFGGGGASRGF